MKDIHPILSGWCGQSQWQVYKASWEDVFFDWSIKEAEVETGRGVGAEVETETEKEVEPEAEVCRETGVGADIEGEVGAKTREIEQTAKGLHTIKRSTVIKIFLFWHRKVMLLVI